MVPRIVCGLTKHGGEMERTKRKTCDHQGIRNMFFGSYMSLSHEPIRLYDTIWYYNILYYYTTICISSKCDAEYMMWRQTRHLSSHIGWSVPALRTSKMPPASSTWSQRSQWSQRLHVSQTVQTVQRRGIKKIKTWVHKTSMCDENDQDLRVEISEAHVSAESIFAAFLLLAANHML